MFSRLTRKRNEAVRIDNEHQKERERERREHEQERAEWNNERDRLPEMMQRQRSRP